MKTPTSIIETALVGALGEHLEAVHQFEPSLNPEVVIRRLAVRLVKLVADLDADRMRSRSRYRKPR